MMALLPGPGPLKSAFRDLVRHRLQLALMVLGVALGSSVVVAIDLANTSASRAFDLSTEALVGRATHRITSNPSGVPVSLYRDLVLEHEDVEFAPVVEALVSAPILDDRPLRVLGVDLLSEGPFRDLLGSTRSPQAMQSFYVEPNQALVSSGLAEDSGLGAGDQLSVQVNDGLVPIRIAGVLFSQGAGGTLTDDVLLMDVAVAQDLLSTPASLSRIDVIADQEDMRTLLASLPDSVSLTPASEQTRTASELTAAFRLNLTALSLLALVVGVFLIYNTLMFSVVRRRQVLAIMRSLGVTREQTLLTIAIEAGMIGLIGGAIGIGLGWILGQGAVRLVSRTINDLYFVLTVREAYLTVGIISKGMLLAMGASVLAAIGPGWEAASIPPASALQRSTLERKVRSWLAPASLLGVLLAVGGTVVLWLSGRTLALSFAGMFMILLGLSCLVPAGMAGIMRCAAWAFGRVGSVPGRLAPRAVVRALSRTSIAVAALMVALAVTIGVGVMIESFRSTVENWLDLTLRADIYVSRPVIAGGRPPASLDPELVDLLAGLPGVSDVEAFRSLTVESDRGPIELTVVDTRQPRSAGLYRLARGSAEQIWSRVRTGSVLVSEPLSVRNGILPGAEPLRLRTDHGWQDFPVEAVYYDYSSDRGAVLMSDDAYRQYWEDRRVSSVALFVDDSASIAGVADSARAALRGSGLMVQENRAVRNQALRVFDRTFSITAALRLLAVIVAFVGILSGLLALQIERRRELATLRALGVTPHGLARMTLLETGLMGMTSGVLAVPTGLALAAVLAYVINVRSFGWRIELVLAPRILAQAVVIGIVAALLAGLYPVWRLRGLPIADLLRTE